MESRVDEIVAFRQQLVDAYIAAGLHPRNGLYSPTDDLYLTDAAVMYVKDPTSYGVDPLRTLVLHERYRRMVCGRATQEQIEALEDEICEAHGEPPPIRLTLDEKTELQQKVKAAVAAMKTRTP
jgi:hypothetical protein